MDANVLLLLALVAAVRTIVWLLIRLWHLRQEVGAATAEVSRVSAQIREEAMAQLQAGRQRDYDTLKREQAEIATCEARVQLEQWKNGTESTDPAPRSGIWPFRK